MSASNVYAQDLRNTMAGWHFSPDEIVATLKGDRLLNVSLDLSNPCNLNCPYCFIEEKNSARKIRYDDELSLEETEVVLRDFAAAGAKTVNLVGAGEPTIDPAFRHVVQMIHSLKMIAVVFTNGIRLAHDIDTLSFLYENNATIVLKYNSGNSELQDLVAGRKGYTEKRAAALDRLMDHGFHSHLPTRLAFDVIAFKGNQSEIPTIHRYCRLNGIFPIVGDFIPTGRTEAGNFAGYASLRGIGEEERQTASTLLQPLSSSERRVLWDEIKQIDEVEFGILNSGASAYYGGGKCTQILGLYIDIHGNIWPCVARTRRVNGASQQGLLGQIRRGQLPSHIWKTHEYMEQIRSDFDGGCPYKQTLPSPSTARLRILT